LKGVATIPNRSDPNRPVRLEQIVCPNCGKSYDIDVASLGRAGRLVRCKNCNSQWFEPPFDSERTRTNGNPVLSPNFPRWMKQYLNALPDEVKRSGTRLTHVIKTFLMRYAVGKDAVGFASGIKVNLENFKSGEFLWDAAGKVLLKSHPGEDNDLTFVAETENQIDVNKIIEDANKLPIARADMRLMFFRANNASQCLQVFDRLHDLFKRHRKSEAGDAYILAGMDMQTLSYAVRKLTLHRAGSNLNPWEEF
jgi:predicted Zn finger-like uncharacterized protein